MTDLRRARELPIETEERLRSITEGSPDYIMLLDPDGQFLFVNRTLPPLTVEDVLGKSIYDFVETTQRPAVEACLESVLETGRPDRFTAEYRYADGETRTFESRVGPVLRDDSVVGLCLVSTDVTEKQKPDDAVRESEGRWRTLLDCFPQGVGMVLDGRITYANPALSELLGYSLEEFLGRSPGDFLPAAQRKPATDRIERLYANAPEYPSEYTLVKKDGSVLPVEILSRRIEYEGRPALLSVFRDLTDVKRAEEEKRQLEAQMQHSQKLESLGILAGGIAHDFNNLLTGILGNASLALMSLPDDSRARDAVVRVESSARRAAELTNQLLAYSGKGKFVVEPIDLSELVEEMVELLKASVSKKTTIHLRLDRDLPVIEADAAQIRQVVMNLITNASESLEGRSGALTVSTEVVQVDASFLTNALVAAECNEGIYVCVEVSDEGAGMGPEIQEKIFDPFFTTKFTGRGLGLAAVQGIVRGHHGIIRVESTLGRGTRFRVLFPAAERKPATAQPRPTRPMLGSES